MRTTNELGTDESFEVRHDRPGLLSMGSRGPGTNSSQVSCCLFLVFQRLFFSSSLLSFSLSRWLENAVRSAGVHRSRGAEKARSSRCGVLPSFRITKCKCRLSSFLISASAFRFRVAAACDAKWSKSAPGFPRIYVRMHVCMCWGGEEVFFDASIRLRFTN